MTFCTGCQDFKKRLFNPKYFQNGFTSIHKNFTELSICADSVCDLCKYIRRQFYYHSADFEKYAFNDNDFEDLDREVAINIFFSGDKDDPSFHTSMEKRLWQVFLGRMPGPSGNTSNRWVEDKSANQRTVTDDLSIEALLLLSRQWLATCIAEHKNCGPQAGIDSEFRPTRLLEVGRAGQQSIRLVLSEDLPRSKRLEYTTLSYCWGDAKDAACTTKDNLVERLTEIPIESLPKTLQDAVEITRALNVKYLWVDALCIIQVKEGQNEDWQHESITMGKIYRHSLVTIAASGARDSSMGCFYRRKASYWPVQSYYFLDDSREPGPDNPVILEPTLPNWNVAVENSPLAKRGWVLQERMLASRTLFWTADGLFWDCTELKASECQHKLSYTNRKYPLLHELVKSIGNPSRVDSSTPNQWTDVVEEYSQKGLTVASDKLPAILGLGMEVSRLTGKEFEMGIWKNNIIQQLAWVSDFSVLGTDDPVTPQATRILGTPTWLWASVHQKLHFKPQRRHDRNFKELASVLSFDTKQIRIRSRLQRIQITKMRYKLSFSYELVYHPTPCTFTPTQDATAENPYDNRRELAIFDTLLDTLPGDYGTVTCLQWIQLGGFEGRGQRGNVEGSTLTGAIIVSPVDEEKMIYRRIGWLEVMNDSLFQGETETIFLV